MIGSDGVMAMQVRSHASPANTYGFTYVTTAGGGGWR